MSFRSTEAIASRKIKMSDGMKAMLYVAVGSFVCEVCGARIKTGDEFSTSRKRDNGKFTNTLICLKCRPPA